MSDAAGAARRAITQRAGIVAAGSLGSRLLGALRDVVIAASFPVAATDAFFVAWTIPNTLRQLLGEGAVSAAFVPLFARIDERHSRDAARSFYQRFGGTLLSLLVLISVVGVLTAPAWATLYAGGYRADARKFELTVQLTALVFPYIALAGWAALQAGLLNAVGRFFVASFSPSVVNVCFIAAPWLLVPVATALGLPAVAALALAALLGGLLQCLVQIPSVRAVGMARAPQLGFTDPVVREGLTRMAPLLLGTGIYQLNILLSRLLASHLPEGSQSYLYYGQRLVEIPQGMLAVAVASASLPTLSRLLQQGELEAAKSALHHGLRLTLFLAIPASLALAALAVPTITVLFGRGHFDTADATLTAHALVYMAAGVWAVSSVQNVTRMFYALGDTRTPVVCSAINLVTFLLTSVLLIPTLQHAAIALANSVAAVVQLAVLVVRLHARVGALGLGGLGIAALRSLACAAAMAMAAQLVVTAGSWERGGNDAENLAVYALAVVVGFGTYLLASLLLRSPELQALGAALRRRDGATDGA